MLHEKREDLNGHLSREKVVLAHLYSGIIVKKVFLSMLTLIRWNCVVAETDSPDELSGDCSLLQEDQISQIF